MKIQEGKVAIFLWRVGSKKIQLRLALCPHIKIFSTKKITFYTDNVIFTGEFAVVMMAVNEKIACGYWQNKKKKNY